MKARNMVLLLILINNDLVHAQEIFMSKLCLPLKGHGQKVPCFCPGDTASYHTPKACNIRASQSINTYIENLRDDGDGSIAGKARKKGL
jgi:hypothetical protein